MSLAAKLAEVMGAIDRIPKSGRNTFHGYDYVTEADLADAIRGKLAERKVILVPDVVGCEMRDMPPTAKGKAQFLTTLNIQWTFRDGESEEAISFHVPGFGIDGEDKGGYKAFTGSEKYALLKFFLVPTGDDPERDDKRNQQQTRTAPAETVAVIKGVIQQQTADEERYWWKIQNGIECLVFCHEASRTDYSRLIEQEGKQVTLKVYDRGERKGLHIYELADVVKVEPVPESSSNPTTQVASPIAAVVEPVPQKINPMTNIDETLLVCTPSDVVSELANVPRYQMVHYDGKQIASCWDHKLWPELTLTNIVGKECVFKVEKKKVGNKTYTNIKAIVSIGGVPQKKAS